MFKKLISLVLSVVMLLSLAVLPANALVTRRNTASVSDDGGYEMPPIGIILEAYHNYYKMMSLLTGNENYSEKKYNLIVDEMFQNIMNSLYEECGIDFSVVYNNLPETNQYAEFITTKLNINIPELQARLIKRQLELEGNGEMFKGAIVRLFCVWIGIVDECYLTCEPAEDQDGVVQIILHITYRDGRTDTVHSPVYYNTETQTFTSKDGGPVFLGFYFDAGNGTTYTGHDVWQRNFGYTFLYDLICYCNPFFISFSTERIKFNYDDRQWMVQLWKGRYFITNGAEVAIYTRDKYATGTYYNCVSEEDEIPMSLKLQHGDDVFFEIPQNTSWWLSKFKINRTAYLPSKMTLTTSLEMKDTEMLSAFTASLDTHSNLSYTVDGLNVTITW